MGWNRAAEPVRAKLASDAAAVPQDGAAGSGTSPAGPAAGETLLKAIALLAVAEERPDGYNRELFRYGIGVDGDGCSTREQVLLAEAIAAPTVGESTGRCELTGGTWHSYYDGQDYFSPDDVEVDHVVPLAEAWRSGADAWEEDRLQDYGNDLIDSRTLVAVEKSLNEAKGDQEPGEWLPPDADARCRYLEDWVAIKTAWALTIDADEKADLQQFANGCP